MDITVEPIGIIHSCYTEKFGIPKQPGLVASATARLELLSPCNREEMVKGLEGFSHLWVTFLFHQTRKKGWKTTVRPPRLGGQRRVGVFASRSPHRPNHLGMSAVRLDNIVTGNSGVVLEISGIDLLDGTPVLDIKPYIPYSDRIEDARCGYTQEVIPEVLVSLSSEAEWFCREYSRKTGRKLQALIVETLRHDPRPASQRTIGREYGMLFWDVNVRWRVTGEGFEVLSCCRLTER